MTKPYDQITQAEKDSWTTVKQFRKFFQSIPICNWYVDNFRNKARCCVRGHLGSSFTFGYVITKADKTLLNLAEKVVDVNNGDYSNPNRKNGIKTRVINYLKSIE